MATGPDSLRPRASGRHLRAALLERQHDDGSWHNENPRWMEDMKTLATSYAMQTLGRLTGRLD